MRKFCESLNEHAMKITNFVKKKMNPSRNHTKRQKSAAFGEKSLNINMLMIKNILKLEIIVIIRVNKEMLHITYVN